MSRRWVVAALAALATAALVIAAGAGWLLVAAPQAARERALAALQPRQVKVRTRPWGPAWLRSLAGEQRFQEVVEVWLIGSGATDLDLEQLAGFPRLEALSLEHSQVRGPGLVHVGRLRWLRTLYLGHAPIAGSHLRELESLGRLEYLSLESMNVTAGDLSFLKHLPRLRHLGLDHTAITDEDLVEVAGLTELESLWLDGTPITGKGFLHLKDLRRLTWLSLTGTEVDDPALAHISRLVNLTRIDLRSTRVTSAGLKELKRLRRLEEAALPQSLGPAALAEIEAALPEVKFHHGEVGKAPDRPRPPR